MVTPPPLKVPLIENSGDALDVGGAGIAGHQMLDQLLANKGRQTGLSENIVQSAAQIRLRRLTRRKSGGRAIHGEKRLCGRIVIALERDHGPDPVGGVVFYAACCPAASDTSSR